ncbi:hypothetical protein [Arthrobacter sp. AET 35A]|uniref:hypothetical protein n=1 Tax=Arthrobacter sp. AET 35A TaxID=2292643 RepID=UPI001782B4DE|nr:hypothetical protein [Arthrobacter sp. AET 35A]
MNVYDLLFDQPVHNFEGRVENQGAEIPERSGVLSFRAFSADGDELPADEIGLPLSTHLGIGFIYLPSTAAGKQFLLKPVKSATPFIRLKIDYEPLFAKNTLARESFGILSYLLDDGVSAHSQGMSKFMFAWPNAVA